MGEKVKGHETYRGIEEIAYGIPRGQLKKRSGIFRGRSEKIMSNFPEVLVFSLGIPNGCKFKKFVKPQAGFKLYFYFVLNFQG